MGEEGLTEYARLARSVRDLLTILDELTVKGVEVRSVKEQFDTSTPQGKLMLTIFAGLAEFEHEMIRQRQREGIELARKQGKYRGRQPLPFDEKQFRREVKVWRAGEQPHLNAVHAGQRRFLCRGWPAPYKCCGKDEKCPKNVFKTFHDAKLRYIFHFQCI